MLDRLPGVRMAGENNNQLWYMRKALQNLYETKDLKLHKDMENVVGAWKHYPIPDQSLACPVQHLFHSINPPSPGKLSDKRYDDSDTIIGWKTVRFHTPISGIDKSIDFLLKHFPCSRIVFNIRGDIQAQKESWKKAFGTDKDVSSMIFINNLIIKAAAKLGPDRARLVDMSEWSRPEGLEVLNDLIQWLGFKNCKYPRLLHENKNKYGVDRELFDLGNHCKWVGN
eukprot:CAMPEP_0184868138 /NCGR_PEP_ID=MMETSP0580-20130426/29280_1 /TAXON_ID=1118495 /ORGANISM="Dactyliosolen fragilissimus" /LENGTH=225 /DNA_ID=CAMNT_0027368817 /DNA_START=488 /DNA_END=1165 /DNA_ORIENTATION=-